MHRAEPEGLLRVVAVAVVLSMGIVLPASAAGGRTGSSFTESTEDP